MSPTPMTFSSPTTPVGYSWEATNEEVAARYGVAPESIVRFDLNTSPTPPALVERLLAAGQFDVPISEYAPSDYGRLVQAAGRRYRAATDELLVGAGADEVLDVIAKAFIAPGSRAVVPSPSYAMYLGNLMRDLGLDPAASSVRYVFCAGEPGFGVPSTRRRLEEIWAAELHE